MFNISYYLTKDGNTSTVFALLPGIGYTNTALIRT